MMRFLLMATLALVARFSHSADGKQVFLDNNCNRCHAVSSHDIEATVKSERMRGPDLSDVGETRDPEWIAKFIAKEVELDGKTHRIPYKGSDEDLKAIAEWLASQKSS